MVQRCNALVPFIKNAAQFFSDKSLIAVQLSIRFTAGSFQFVIGFPHSCNTRLIHLFIEIIDLRMKAGYLVPQIVEFSPTLYPVVEPDVFVLLYESLIVFPERPVYILRFGNLCSERG